MNVPVESPRSLDAALAALAGATPDTVLLAGGTDLMVELETGRTRPGRIVDIWRVDELRAIGDDAGGLRIGALATCTDLLADDRVRARADILATAALEVGAVQIRNRATLGGNLGTASPAADLNPVLLALGATVRLCSAKGRRDVPCEAFLCGYRTTLRRADELIESVWIPPRAGSERRAFRKVGTRRAQSIAKVVIAAAATVDDGTVTAATAAAGSVAARTIALEIAPRLVGQAPDTARIDAAARAAAASCTPIDDVRSTAHYRQQVLYRTLRTALTDILGDR